MKIFPQELEEQGKSLERFVWRQLGSFSYGLWEIGFFLLHILGL